MVMIIVTQIIMIIATTIITIMMKVCLLLMEITLVDQQEAEAEARGEAGQDGVDSSKCTSKLRENTLI